jgi:hypothetical protein
VTTITCPECGHVIVQEETKGIPDQMKNDNWALFVLARSNNPEIMIPYTQKLVSNLMMSVKIANTHEFDEMLDFCSGAANFAVMKLSDIMKQDDPNKDWGQPIIKCEYILSRIGIMIYDPKKRWAITQAGAFRYPSSAASVAKQEVK